MIAKSFFKTYYIILSILLISLYSRADDKKFVKLFDSKTNNKFNIADPRFPSMALIKNIGNDCFHPIFGASLPIMRLGIKDKSIDLIINALNYNDMQIKTVGLNLYTAEYYVNASLQINLSEKITISIAKGHTSHHLLDDAINQNNIKPINFVKDFYNSYIIYNTPKKNSIYIGYSYIYHFLVDENIGKKQDIILGFNVNYLNAKNYMLYIASDIKFKQEYNFNSSVSIQTGININKKVRLAVNYFNGYSENGQYYKTYQNNISAAVYIDAF